MVRGKCRGPSNSFSITRLTPTDWQRLARVHVHFLNHYDYWRRQRTIREGVVVSVVLALVIGVFLGVIHVMITGLPPHAAAWISSFSEAPATSDDNDDYEDDVASENSQEDPVSPSE
jgi:hypothetical protein